MVERSEQQIAVVTLGIADIARSRRFYVDGFGWKPVFENPEIIFYQMNGLVLATWHTPALEEDMKTPDLARPGALAAALGKGRLAVAQTQTVPAGKYARQALQALGHWPAVQGRLAEAESVRVALMLVARGETPLGVVYASDARAEPRVQVVATFPAGSHPPIIYPVAAVAPATPAARGFVRWLAGPQARAIFARHGFHPQD